MMRRMRDLNWRDYLLIAGAVGVAFGIHWMWRNAGQGGRHTLGETIAAKAPGAGEVAGGEGWQDRDGAASAPDSPTIPVTDGSGRCISAEYAGRGPKGTKISDEDWTRVMTQFHEVKGAMLSWLRHRRGELPPDWASVMEAQMRNLKIQRPPSSEEPDLAWRGVGIWTQKANGQPVIRVGGGFPRLAKDHSMRSRFELARLVAQAWAPCELKRVGGGEPWDRLLKCMGVNDAGGCDIGAYSESGWAVSTAVAASVANPGCAIPAFADSSAGECLKKIPLPMTASLESPVAKEVALSEGGAR